MEKRVPHEQLCGIFQYYENRTENISKKQQRAQEARSTLKSRFSSVNTAMPWA